MSKPLVIIKGYLNLEERKLQAKKIIQVGKYKDTYAIGRFNVNKKTLNKIAKNSVLKIK